MRCERRGGPGYVEQQLLPVINIVFLLVPVLLVVIELTSLAALQATTPDAPQAAQAPTIRRASETLATPPATRRPVDESAAAAESPEPAPLFPDQMLGYGF